MILSSHPTLHELKFVPLIMLPLALGITYFVMALLFRRRVRWAGWVAFAITLLLFLAWTTLGAMASYNVLSDSEHVPWPLKCLVLFMFIAFDVGLAAVAVEVLQAMRARLAWSPSPAPPL
jgi:hypothetical protein